MRQIQNPMLMLQLLECHPLDELHGTKRELLRCIQCNTAEYTDGVMSSMNWRKDDGSAQASLLVGARLATSGALHDMRIKNTTNTQHEPC